MSGPADDRTRLQRALSLDMANRARLERAKGKAGVRSGRVSLTEVLNEQPAELAKLSLWELVRLRPGLGVERCAQLNAAAIRAGINLALPLGRASAATRGWLLQELSAIPASGVIATGARAGSRVGSDASPSPRRQLDLVDELQAISRTS